MKERTLSGAMLVLFLLTVVVFNSTFPLALNLVVGVISALAVFELIKAMNLQKNLFMTVPSLITAMAAPILHSYSQTSMYFLYIIHAAVLFSMLLYRHKELDFKEMSVILCMTILIPVALGTLISLRSLGGDHGMFYVLIAIFASWISDAGAYFAGTFFGKHKLAPNISPKKTVEGVIGGLILNIIAMVAFGLLFQNVKYAGAKEVNYLVLAIIGFVGSFTSLLGDLSFSLIKRSCHIKDFGQVIPGHGGILDRFDSVIFTAPFVFMLVTWMPIVLN